MKHSRAEVAAAWLRNGGKPGRLLEALAVAESESGLDSDASSSCCHGVWALHTMHTSEKCARDLDCATKRAVEISKGGDDWSAWVVHPSSVKLRKYDPNWRQANANYRKALASVSNDKTWQRNLMVGLPGLPGIPGVPLPPFVEDWLGGAVGDVAGAAEDVVTGVPDGLAAVASVLKDIARFVVGLGELILTPAGWKRLGFLLGGGVFVLIGLQVVMRSGFGVDAVGTGRKVAAKVATKGLA